ncbi:hypothetical protein WJX73_000124 [Symbiochloris irregularis]|uniref:Uncharacterized protein n=1 Tax=Symbiochloris irregularis TaxID=706552 RepID=A0AAW1NSG9_9CHLO
MLPILVALGATGALLELRRLVSRPEAEPLADADVQSLRENEHRLKQLLQELQRELESGKEDLAEQRVAAEALFRAQEELASAKEALEEENCAISQEADELRGRNDILNTQVIELQAAHEEALKELKASVVEAIERYSEGDISPECLLEELQALGIDASVTLPTISIAETEHADPTEPFEQPEDQSAEPTPAAAQDIPLLTHEWASQLQLMSHDPERLARLLTTNALRAANSGAIGHRPSRLGLPFQGSAAGYQEEPRLIRAASGTLQSLLTPRQPSGSLSDKDSLQLKDAEKSGWGQLQGAAGPSEPAPAKEAAAPSSLRALQIKSEGSSSPNKALQFAPARAASGGKSSTPRLGLDVVFGSKQSSPVHPSSNKEPLIKAVRPVPALNLPKSTNAIDGPSSGPRGQELALLRES